MQTHPQARGPLAAWLKEAQAANWSRWAEIKARYPTADLVRGKGAGRQVIFNIKGNDYPLHARVYFRQGVVVIERIGTHAQYSKWKLDGSS
jgi:mRNA interferase HigB